MGVPNSNSNVLRIRYRINKVYAVASLFDGKLRLFKGALLKGQFPLFVAPPFVPLLPPLLLYSTYSTYIRD